MKKINIYFVLLFSAAILIACDDDNNNLGEENPNYGWLQFDAENTEKTFVSDYLIEDQTSELNIPFRYTAPINSSEITLNYVLSDVQGNSSDIIEESSGSSTISAESIDGVITLNVNLISLLFNIDNEYVFDIVMNSASNSAGEDIRMGIDPDFASTARITVKQCQPAELAGMYNVETTYITNDCLTGPISTGEFSTFSTTAEISDEGDGNFSVPDFSGGLYTAPESCYVGAYNMNVVPFIFKEECGIITWTGQSDTWGEVVYGTDENGDTVDSTYDFETGVITMHWYCVAYAEEGISVYTPQ